MPGQEKTSQSIKRARHPLSAPALLIGALGTPLAWFVQIAFVEAVSAQSCFRYDTPMPQPWLHGASTTVAAVSAVSLVIGVGAALLAWRNRRLADTVARESGAGSDRALLRRVVFITRVSLMSSLLFVAGQVATDLAGLIAAPCARW